MDIYLTPEEFSQLTRIFKGVFERNKDKEVHIIFANLVTGCVGAIDNGYEETA